MQQDLASLRQAVREWLDDPDGDEFTDARVDRLINESYQNIANDLLNLAQPWSVKKEADYVTNTVTTDSATREYSIGAVRRIESVGILSGNNRFTALDLVEYGARNVARAPNGIYTFREQSTGEWYIGVVYLPPAWATLIVHSVPPLAALVHPDDVPREIPPDHHELLVYRAAMLGKMQVNRESTALVNLYLETRGRMLAALTTMKTNTRSNLLPR